MRRIGMRQKELRRVEVLARVKSKELKVLDAASLVGVSYRQAKRLWKRYREEGAQGLKYRSAGRASAGAKPARFRRRVMRLVREKYGEGEGERFGPTLAAEHLASGDGMRMDAETLRRWMLEEGLWSRRRKRKPYRQRRERRRHFGELVQMDGSFHDWLEEGGPDGCMMNMVDDATSEVELGLGEEETIRAAANTLRAWIEKHGVPQAL
jgi:transposase